MIIERSLTNALNGALERAPAVVLTGPRQVGKTTLALQAGKSRGALYLDLERPSDLVKVQNFEQFCALYQDRMIILDEVQRIPEIFAPLRGIIDQRRREGKKSGQFLLLGSASLDLLRQSSESLAGRVAHLELHGLNPTEVDANDFQKLWLRGGFPESFLSRNHQDSLAWRNDFISTYLERDIPQLGPRIAHSTLRRFWTMLAHSQAQTLNASMLERGLGLSSVTIGRYLDLMVDLLLVRRLQPWHSNLGKRMVKAPKVYVRDSGICHALLGLSGSNDLLGHPVVGGSWEGFVIEAIDAIKPPSVDMGYYRTAAGAEVDLILSLPSREVWAVEIKLTSAPKLSRGFYLACEDLKPSRKIIIHAGEDRFVVGDGVEAIPLGMLETLF